MHKVLAIIVCMLVGGLPALGQNIDSLKTVASSSPNTTRQVQSLNALSKAYKTKNTQTAIKYAQQSVEVAKKINFKEGLADAYANLGQANAFLADEQSDPTNGYEKAAQYFRQSFDIYDQLYSEGKLNRSKMLKFLEGGVITVYRDLADIYYSEKKNYKQASDKYRVLFNRFGEYSAEIKDESLVVSRTKLLNQRLNQELLEKKQQALKNELQIKKVEKEKDSLALANQRRKIESTKRELRLRALQSENLKIQKDNEEKAHRLEIAAQEAQLKRSRLLTTFMIVGLVLVFIIVGVLFYSYRRQRKVNKIISRQQAEIVEEKERSDSLLLNILPREVADELKKRGKASIRQYEMVSVLFTDFKGFTSIAEKITPVELVRELETCFLRFDEIIEKYNIEKIKTIGDAYMAAGGIPIANQTNPLDVVLAGLEMQQYMNELKAAKKAAGNPYWELRLGINTGKIIAGVIGKKKFAYDVWGDTVNTASRMESSGEVGKVNISGKTYELVKDFFECEHRGKVTAKGKGDIDMYFVRRIKTDLSADSKGLIPNDEFNQMRDKYQGLAIS